MVRVQCPYCHRRYRTELEAFGRTAVCTKCSESFRIGESRPPFEWKPTGLAEDSWIGVEPPEEQPERKHCIQCDRPLEPGVAHCPECGANQVTGLVQRPKPAPVDDRIPLSSRLPLRPLLIAAGLAILGWGAYLALRSFSRSAEEISEAIADQGLVAQAARFLREHPDADSLPHNLIGRVTDASLGRYLERMSANDPAVRRAAALMIAAGQVADVGPIVALAEVRETATAGLQVLDAIGGRALVALSCREDPKIRLAAARALCLLNGLPLDDKTLRELSEATTPAAKIRALNGLCGTWPQGTGAFHVVIGETRSAFTVTVEQIGRTFGLRVGTTEFRSTLVAGAARFVIPVDRWCSATGNASDADLARESLAGTIMLAPVVGGMWEGTVRVTARRTLSGPPSGFLPVGPLDRGRLVEVPVRLVRGTS